MCLMRPLTSNLYALTSFRNHNYLQLNRHDPLNFSGVPYGTSPESEFLGFFHIWIQILRLIVHKMDVR